MARWTFLAVAVIVMIVSQEISFSSGADAHDSAAMTKFKKSLSAEEQALLKRHSSKGQFIESLLGRNKGVDKRDQIAATGAAHDKRSESAEMECCSCNPGSTGCFHPTDTKRSRIIRCCIPGPSPQKRDEIDAEEALDEASPADQAVLKKHMSKINNLVNAANQPAGEETNSKRSEVNEKKNEKKQADELTEEQKEALQSMVDQLKQLQDVVTNLKEQKGHAEQTETQDKRVPAAAGTGVDITKRFMDDVNLAKKYGVKLDDLLGAMKRRTAAGQKKGTN